MTEDTPLPPLQGSHSVCNIIPNSLNDTFDAMLLYPSLVSSIDFNNEWGATNTEQALMLSGGNDARLKDWIVAASALVWGASTMHPAQLEACFCLLHPHRPNSLVVIHQKGGGGDAHTAHVLCNWTKDCFNFYSTALKPPILHGVTWVYFSLTRSTIAIDWHTAN